MGENKGNLIIIGGKEDRNGECRILKHIVAAVAERGGKLVIMTTASENPGEIANDYVDVFKKLGIENMDILDISSREEADLDKNSDRIKDAGGIFFTGGDQLRITSVLGGTAIYRTMHDLYRNGMLYIGTSAGAAAMSSTMIVEGDDNQPARKCTLKMAPGLAFIEEAIIEQHFDQRGRLGRLLCGVAQNPHFIGIGIDEDTAVQVLPDARFAVLGSNAVTVVDGAPIKVSNVSRLKPNETLAMTDIKLHVLPYGYGYDMKMRRVLRQSGSVWNMCNMEEI